MSKTTFGPITTPIGEHLIILKNHNHPHYHNIMYYQIFMYHLIWSSSLQKKKHFDKKRLFITIIIIIWKMSLKLKMYSNWQLNCAYIQIQNLFQSTIKLCICATISQHNESLRCNPPFNSTFPSQDLFQIFRKPH
jgi:hypothetical protein